MGSDGLNFEQQEAEASRAFGSRARWDKTKNKTSYTQQQQINYRLKKNREQVSETKKKVV